MDPPFKPKFHLAHRDMTHYFAHAFWHRQKLWCAVSHLLDSATCVIASATSTSRQARLAWHSSGVLPLCGLGSTCPPHIFQKLFLRLMQIQSTKDWTCTCKHCFLFIFHQQARHDALVMTCATCATHSVCNVMPWCNKWNLGFTGQFADKPTCGWSCRRLINLQTSQMTKSDF